MLKKMLKKRVIKKTNLLLDFFDSYNLSKISYKKGKVEIFISDTSPKTEQPMQNLALERVITSPSLQQTEELTSTTTPQQNAPLSSGNHQVLASMTGAFYRKPKPDAEFFVQDGALVEADTTVCLLEAMKMFNEIKAGVKGKLVKAHAEDGDFVAEGDILFEIQPL